MTHPPYHLRDLYTTKNEFLLYDRLHRIADAMGYVSADDVWNANPQIEDVLAAHTAGETK